MEKDPNELHLEAIYYNDTWKNIAKKEWISVSKAVAQLIRREEEGYTLAQWVLINAKKKWKTISIPSLWVEV